MNPDCSRPAEPTHRFRPERRARAELAYTLHPPPRPVTETSMNSRFSPMRLSTLAFLAAMCLLTGCATLNLEPPDLHLADLDLEEVTVLESTGTVTLRIVNSNPEPLKVDGVALTLRLNGRKIGKILSSEAQEIPRLATETIQGELHVSHLAVLTLVQEIMDSQEADYSLSGKVYLLTDLGRRSIRVDRSGSFDFNEGGAPVGSEL